MARTKYATQEDAKRAARDLIVSLREMLVDLEHESPASQFLGTLRVESLVSGLGHAVRDRHDLSESANELLKGNNTHQV
jgi:hypothetical protein